MNTARPRWDWAMATIVAIEGMLIAIAFGWVAIYSHLIHTGESIETYRAYAQGASPIVALVAGVPVWFLAGRLMRRRLAHRARPTFLIAVTCYVVLGAVAVLAMADNLPYDAAVAAGHWITAAIAGGLGVRKGVAA